MPSVNLVFGVKRRRETEDDQSIVKQSIVQLHNKRQKLSPSTGILTTGNDTSSDSPTTTPPSKCPPLSISPAVSVTQPQLASSSRLIGPYRILAPLEDNPQIFTAVHTDHPDRLVICRRLDRSKYTHMIKLAHRLQTELDEEENKLAYEQIFPPNFEVHSSDDGFYYSFEPQHYGTLHAHVVERKRLTEQECLWYFRQILHLLIYCHRRRVVLRDLKLRKFVFADAERRMVRLDGIDELFVCQEMEENTDGTPDDLVSDRHGCPAYVGPEILDIRQKSYSGRPADIWSLGVLLYVALYGRYPFYDTMPARLFAKIRHAVIHTPDDTGVSFEARSLIRFLLRRDPSERPSGTDILSHPWLQPKTNSTSRRGVFVGSVIVSSATGIRYIFTDRNVDNDQCVPSVGNDQARTKAIANLTRPHRASESRAVVPEQ